MRRSKGLSRIAMRMPVRAPRTCGFLKDLAVLHHAFWGENRAFPSKYRASPCIPRFLKDLGQVSMHFTGTQITVFRLCFDLSFHVGFHGNSHGGAALLAAGTPDPA